MKIILFIIYSILLMANIKPHATLWKDENHLGASLIVNTASQGEGASKLSFSLTSLTHVFRARDL